MRDNLVRRTLESGRSSFGTMVFGFDCSGIGRLAHDAGADFVLFDQEHSGWSIDTIRNLIASSRSCPITPLVRVPTVAYHLIAPVLDVGAAGIMAPMVNTPEQAQLLADSCYYPPVGRRGAAFGVGHDDYASGDVVEKMQSANREVLVIAQIETEEGVRNVDAIAGTDGIHVLWIGHFDLTNSLGIPAQFDRPRYLDAVARVMDACNAHGKAAGFMASTPAETEWALASGFRILALGGDLWIYREALRQSIRTARTLQ